MMTELVPTEKQHAYNSFLARETQELYRKRIQHNRCNTQLSRNLEEYINWIEYLHNTQETGYE